MSYRRRAAVLLVILGALGGASAFAATTCPTGNAGGQYGDPAFTCMFGPFAFKSFSFKESQGGIPLSEIILTPIDQPGGGGTPGGIGFQVRGDFRANAGQTFTYTFSYFIDPPPPIIHGEQVDLDPMGSVTLMIDLCTTAFPCQPGNSLGQLNASTANQHVMTTFGQDRSTLGLQFTLTLTGGNVQAMSGGFDSTTMISTPEPAAIVLMASGLVGLLALRFRSKVRQVFLQFRS